MNKQVCISLIGLLLAALAAPLHASVAITSLTPSTVSPQRLGTAITWTAQATDSNPGPLAFQFNVAVAGVPLQLARDFNLGNLNAGTWTSQPFVWAPTLIEGLYQIQVVIKDFSSGETASQTATFQVNPLATGSTPVIASTINPLVALFSAPSCAAGSVMRVQFQIQSTGKRTTNTPYLACHPPYTMNFEIAGMYQQATYSMFSQTLTAGKITNGPTVTFTTGALPVNIPFPKFTEIIPPGRQTDTADSVLLLNPIRISRGPLYTNVAVDLAGKVLWYYYPEPAQSIVLTRPLSNGTMLTLQNGGAWNPRDAQLQFIREIDLAGNIIRETNVGVIQQQLLAMGAVDGGPCQAFAKPAPVGAACLDGFNHDAIQTLPNGYTAVIASAEKIFAPGTQGDTSGLPVDIVGDMIIVLDTNWQVVWYFDSFEHAGGAPQLDINRPAVLGENCDLGGCPVLGLFGSGISPTATDWTHGNSLYYWPQTQAIIWSSRNQDWVTKIDYANGTGSGNILWRLGPCGDFSFNNIYNDPWPWQSAQHDAGMENNGAGPMTLLDNGSTRVSPPTGIGSSSACMPGVGSGNSRGMALTVDESAMSVTPLLSVDLGVYSPASGSAQLLSTGNYFYVPAKVQLTPTRANSDSIEILPTPGTDTGTQVLDLQTTNAYRAWRMPDLYRPPTT